MRRYLLPTALIALGLTVLGWAVDTRRQLDDFNNASTGLFADNAAGDIGAQDLRDFVYTVMGASFPKATLETTDFTAVVGTSHGVDVDNGGTGLNDNIEVTAPASPTRGDRFRVFVARANTTDAAGAPTSPFGAAPHYCVEPATNFGQSIDINDASYTAHGAGGGAKWSLWLAGEYLEFEYVDATVGWIVVDDGRIPHVARANRTTDFDLPNSAETKITGYNSSSGNAGLFNSTNDRIDIKRANNYSLIYGGGPHNDQIVATSGGNSIRIKLNGTSDIASSIFYNSGAVASMQNQRYTGIEDKDLSAADWVGLYMTMAWNTDSAGNRDVAGSLMVRENK